MVETSRDRTRTYDILSAADDDILDYRIRKELYKSAYGTKHKKGLRTSVFDVEKTL